MGLAPFDNTWYCDKCGKRIKDEDDFLFCPNCGTVLKNDWYQMSLESIVKFLKNGFARSICEDCCEEFEIDYNFCPLCSKELKKESILIGVEKDNSITANWNGEKIWVFDKDIFISDPYFSGATVIKCFKDKDYFDDKLKSDFIQANLKPPKRLTYDETYSIASLGTSTDEIRGIKFVPELSEDILSNENFEPNNKINYINRQCTIVKLRENLYAKVKVEYVRDF